MTAFFCSVLLLFLYRDSLTLLQFQDPCTLENNEPYCVNGGKCSVYGGLPHCQCPKSFTGDHCEIGMLFTNKKILNFFLG